jgi:hypothetical protein
MLNSKNFRPLVWAISGALTLVLVIASLSQNSTASSISSGGAVGAGTINQLARYPATGTSVVGSAVFSNDANFGYLDQPLDIKTNSLVIEVANSGAPGTEANKLVKIPAGSASVLTTSAADVISAIGVVVGGAGTTGNAQIGVLGRFSCFFDNTATTAGDYITPSSTTAGTCHDAGASYPTSGEVMGQVLSSNASCGSPPCGPYAVVFGTPDIFLPGSGGSNGGGGGNPNRAFSGITSGTNAQAAMVLGTGASLAVSGSGTIAATTSAALAANPTDCSAGQFANAIAANGDLTCGGPPHVISFVIDGGGSAITTGNKEIYPTANFSCTINRIDISADQSGSITVDVWKKAGAIPTGSDKISASAPLTLSSAQLSQNGSLTGWTTAVSSGDVFGFSVASATTVERVIGQIWCQ